MKPPAVWHSAERPLQWTIWPLILWKRATGSMELFIYDLQMFCWWLPTQLETLWNPLWLTHLLSLHEPLYKYTQLNFRNTFSLGLTSHSQSCSCSWRLNMKFLSVQSHFMSFPHKYTWKQAELHSLLCCMGTLHFYCTFLLIFWGENESNWFFLGFMNKMCDLWFGSVKPYLTDSYIN